MRLEKIYSLISIIALSFAGCTSSIVSKGGATIADVLDTPYDGPKARVSVVRFENKVNADMMMQFQRDMARLMVQAQKSIAEAMKNLNQQQEQTSTDWLSAWSTYSDPISSGIKEMLVSELVNCNRFLVYERENLDVLLAEQALSADSKAKIKEELEGVELFIFGALTEFSATSQGGEVSVPVPIMGKTFDTKIGYKKAHVAMDLRIVDTRTGRIVAVTTVKGSATDIGFLTTERTTSELPTTLEGYQNTPVEAAIRKMIKAATNYIVTKTPKDYYHYHK